MKKIGAHVSSSGGVSKAPVNAENIGATAFALFVKNQKQWQAKPLHPEEIQRFREICREKNYVSENILPHAGYLINLGNPDPAGLEKSRVSFIDEIRRCHQLGLKYLVVHPGSHKKMIPPSECLALISESIRFCLDRTEDVCVVIENTAGMGGHMGSRFEELAEIIEKVDDPRRCGICLDTCHMFAAGYDIRTEERYHRTMNRFEKTVGFRYLKGVHMNDSKFPLGSRKDRHHSLGKGELGLKPFGFIAADPRFNHVPLILETIDPGLWPEEIDMLKRMAENGGSDRA